MAKTVALTGNGACAQAMRQIAPDVVAVYPITPQTAIVEEFAQFVADGAVGTEMVNVESEHSAMSACIGASAAGARTMTATSSQGLALMWEMLYIAASLRLPIVMHDANRALSGPINIHCDHSDTMGARDCGWVQLHSENAQEAYDNTIIAVRVAEHMDVRLPVMVMLDGFIISHAIDRLDMLEDDEVAKFVGDFEPVMPLLDTKNPVSVGPFDSLFGYYFEHKKTQNVAIHKAKEVIADVSGQYGRLSGRPYGHFEAHRLDDAEIAIVVLGSTAGTVRVAVDEARSKGVPVGMLKLRTFRPFPDDEIVEALGGAKVVAVMDRCDSFGAPGGPVFMEIRSALYPKDARPMVTNYIYGLGGREVGFEEVNKVIEEARDTAATGRAGAAPTYLGIRQ